MTSMKKLNNTILVCGSGKNVGKTTLSCLLIQHYQRLGKKVYAIKTSTHLHPLDKDEDIIDQSEDYAIVKERRDNQKDSSLMLKSGAIESYYIQSSKDKLFGLFESVYNTINSPNHIIICESGSLRDYFIPRLFIFVTGEHASKNMQYKPLADFILYPETDFNKSDILNVSFLKQLKLNEHDDGVE